MNKQARLDRLAAMYGGDELADLTKQFNEATVASDAAAIPPGRYHCRAVSGELHKSRSGTPGYRVTFVVDDGEHRGVRLRLDCWLTPAALPMAKRDLLKFGVTRLDEPFPQGYVADVVVVKYSDDDGIERNKVRSFAIVERLDDPTVDPDFSGDSKSSNGGIAS
jgi:hypothetical protein